MSSESGRRVISTDKAPAAIGPYSQAVAVPAGSQMVYLSGQIGMDPATGELVSGGVEAQAKQALKNLGEVLAASGSSFQNIVKTNIFLADMADFAAVNAIYTTYFEGSSVFPARACIAAAALPKGASFEIEAVAVAN
ncbi:2-iminobutanoate/2-iminopropanoate deaminase-like [Sycon ciliatum]|uniref:2-iminobutanoate/2-iminopropanoate deaminase-like n=1 Tax=Sycon ciliatum TaxID=27933 RepID=UPI0031F631C9